MELTIDSILLGTNGSGLVTFELNPSVDEGFRVT
jgi:hypothetical protein